jgi:hypothetical protein
VSVLAVSGSFLEEPVSPELVLVSPPEVARIARAQLRDLPAPPVRVAAPSSAARAANVRALELMAVYLFCLFITLGPLVFALITIHG